jgi:hypothetical protein
LPAALPRTCILIEDPGDLGAGEIGIEQQAGRCCNNGLRAVRPHALAHFGGAAILPNDRAIYRLARFAVPYDRCLALIGDADCRKLSRLEAGLCHRLAQRRQRSAPKVIGLVFDPTEATMARSASNTIARDDVVP